MKLRFKKATIEDLDLLTDTRVEVLRAANKLADDADMSEVKAQSIRIIKELFVMEPIPLIWFLTGIDL